MQTYFILETFKYVNFDDKPPRADKKKYLALLSTPVGPKFR